MDALELQTEIADIDVEIEALQEERQELVEILADLPSDNDLWAGPDIHGGFRFLPLDQMRDHFAASGDRALEYASKTNRMFRLNWITVMDGRKYDEMFMRNFTGTKGGSVFIMQFSTFVPEDRDGNKLVDHSVIFRGNLDPYEARQWFENYWSSAEAWEKQTLTAFARMRNLDRRYKRLTGAGRDTADFLQRYPHYTPKD